MRRIAATSVAALLALCACAPAPRPQAEPDARSAQSEDSTPRRDHAAAVLEAAAKTVEELRKATPHHMLEECLKDARAVIILPGIYNAGFIYSLHGGNGVLVARRADGGWGAPVFVSIGGAGFGYQIGLEKSRLILGVMEEATLERMLANGLRLDATAMYDVVGVRESTGPDTQVSRRPVEAYSDGVGIMAGVALRGGVLGISHGLTEAYYGAEGANPQRLMRGSSAPGLEVFHLWNALVVAPGREKHAIRPRG